MVDAVIEEQGRGTVVLLAAAPAGRGRIVDATSVLPALAAVPPGALAGTEVATVVELADPVEPQTVLTRLRAAATAAGAGRLAVYLACQVHMDQRQGLPHLALARTSTATLRYTALPWHWLADALKERRPGTTTVVADLVADADAWRALEKRPELLELPSGTSLFGRITPPPARRAGPSTPDYLRAYATIWRTGERPALPSLHAQASARTAVDPVILLSHLYEPPDDAWTTGTSFPRPEQLPQEEPVSAAEVAPVVFEEEAQEVQGEPVAPEFPMPRSLSSSDDGEPVEVSEAREEEPEAPAPVPPPAPVPVAPVPPPVPVAPPAQEDRVEPPVPDDVVEAAAPPPPSVAPAAVVPEAREADPDAAGVPPLPDAPPAVGAPRPAGDAARGAWGKVRAVARGWRGGAEAVEPEPAPMAVVVAPGQGDPHPGILAAAQAGRHTEAAAAAAAWELDALRRHGAGSGEAIHWLEVRADLARLAGEPARSCELWIAAARARIGQWQDLGHPDVEGAVDRAHHQWEQVPEARARALAPELVELRRQVPGRRAGALQAIQRRLERIPGEEPA
ncbi:MULTISPECIES: hypothetical protein [Streptomyces]|uniref:Uncharacterized protein n=1 Tax=Streptomyces solicathayae TaxID=3081768 RepID=A0ABZ0M3L6_9ACTN|nr:hypothetical protein [Streptomyces sp. HUAS YS2]WOX26235.1 hypothetical protein R2D22_34570 [Streptomyces sp. HUAS YS2]